MFCTECGKEIESESQICPYCGAELKASLEIGQGFESSETIKPVSSNKKKKTIILIIGIVVLIILGIILGYSIITDHTLENNYTQFSNNWEEATDIVTKAILSIVRS